MKKYKFLEIKIIDCSNDILTNSIEGEGNDWGIGELPFSTNETNFSS